MPEEKEVIDLNDPELYKKITIHICAKCTKCQDTECGPMKYARMWQEDLKEKFPDIEIDIIYEHDKRFLIAYSGQGATKIRFWATMYTTMGIITYVLGDYHTPKMTDEHKVSYC